MLSNVQRNNIFLIAGRTGGPFFPLPTVAKNLANFKPIYIGVHSSFEEVALSKTDHKLEYLPDIRLSILTFKKEKLSETVANYLKLLLTGLKFIWALLKSFYLVFKYRPRMVYTTGSFLTLPIVLVVRLCNFIGLTQTKIVVHQQDPDPGISNRPVVKYADKVSCVFEYTKLHYPSFKNAEIIPNPIDDTLYNFTKNQEFQKGELNLFLKKSSPKPVLLIFGGGSGSEDINLWTIKNIRSLLGKFKIIHLTGILQKKKLETITDNDYLRLEALVENMKLAMFRSDLVLCRAGMASITELQFLQKPAFLVPLPATHQEKNAELVASQFYILHQKDRPNWLETINQNYPGYFKNIKFETPAATLTKQAEYFRNLNKLLV